MEMMQQQQKTMDKMDPEDKKKLDEILKRNQPTSDDSESDPGSEEKKE